MTMAAVLSGDVCLAPLDQAIIDVASRGYAHVADALSPAWCAALATEARGRVFVAVPGQVGAVRQEAEALAVRVGDVRFPVMTMLAAALVRGVRSVGAGIGGLAGYRPDEASYYRYRGPSAGISPHRDYKHHQLLVAIFTLVGRARFQIVADRSGTEELASWEAGAGDLCLLRGPGLVEGSVDGRPLHSVGPPVGSERISLAFRMSEGCR